jgi:hypothetical protein
LTSKDTVRIGCGSASADDRIEPGLALIEHGQLDYMALDCLAERTLALAQKRKLADPEAGYDLRLDYLVGEMVVRCVNKGTKFIANMGAANPAGGARRTREILREAGLKGTKVASISGDDVLDVVRARNPIVRETGRPLSELDGEIVSANAYIGARPIVEALEAGADVVMGGRIADPSLFMAPAAFEHGWSAKDWDRLAGGQMVGHLLECATYLTGGNWIDPPYRDVKDLWNLGVPFADVAADGTAVISKLDSTGGELTVDTCKAELIYEIGDPSEYITPDVVMDFTNVEFEQVGSASVRASGAAGREQPPTLKVLVGSLEGWIAEGEVSFGGPGSLERARRCADLVLTRLQHDGVSLDETRVDYIGIDSVFGAATPVRPEDPWEVRLRIAVRTSDAEVAEEVARHLGLMYFGPSGAGGVRAQVRQVLGMSSVLLPREDVHIDVEVVEV